MHFYQTLQYLLCKALIFNTINFHVPYQKLKSSRKTLIIKYLHIHAREYLLSKNNVSQCTSILIH